MQIAVNESKHLGRQLLGKDAPGIIVGIILFAKARLPQTDTRFSNRIGVAAKIKTWLCCWCCLFVFEPALGQQASYDDIRAELFQELNAWRLANGGSAAQRMALTRDQILDEIIQLHVQDKAVCGYAAGGGAHQSCDGRTLRQRAAGQDASGNPVTGAPSYVSAQSGGAGFGENMAFGYQRARDQELPVARYRDTIRAEVIRQNGLTPEQIEQFQLEPQIQQAIDNSVAGLPSCSNPNWDSRGMCRTEDGQNVVEAGFIDSWARSPGHRRNMLGDWGAAGVGYDEETDGAISGQMFGTNVRMAGFRTAAGMSARFRLSGTPPPVVTTPPDPPPPGPDPVDPTTPPVLVMPMPVAERPPLGRPMTTEAPVLPVMDFNERALARSFLELAEADLAELTLSSEAEGLALIRLTEAFANLPEVEDMVQSLDQFAPGANEVVIDAGPLLDLAMSKVMSQRLATLRLSIPGRRIPSRLGEAGTRRSSTVPLAGAADASARVASQDDKFIQLLGLSSNLLSSDPGTHDGGLWSRVYASRGDRRADGFHTAYDREQYTVFGGLDRPWGKRGTLGVLAGIGKLDADFQHDAGESEINHYMGGLYASIFNTSRSAYLNAMFNVGYLDYDQRRRIRIGGVTEYAQGDGDSWLLGGELGAGLLFQVHGVQVEPDLSIHYTRQRTSSLREQGSVLRLEVPKRDTDTWALRTGFNLSGQFDIGGGKISPSLGMHYLREDPRGGRAFSSAFAIAPTLTRAILKGRSDVRHYYQQEVGLEWQVKQHFYMRGDYQLIAGTKLKEHLLSLGLRYEFQ